MDQWANVASTQSKHVSRDSLHTKPFVGVGIGVSVLYILPNDRSISLSFPFDHKVYDDYKLYCNQIER